jgi:hypothetical protein
VEPDDEKLVVLGNLFKRIVEEDQKNRDLCAERTYMGADRYKGGDAADLRQKVEAIVKEKIAQAKVLRVTLPAQDWKEERVLEWTDTTQSAARYRITRFMAAQAAAKGADGKVYLHGIHLAKDRQSDGTWGALYGHIMWSDWMVEQNVKKEPPTR